MNYLFLHNNYAGQFKHIVSALAADTSNTVVFLSNQKGGTQIPRVRQITLPINAPKKMNLPSADTYMKRFYFAEGFGEAMYKLKSEGFNPNLVYSHIGWGCATYAPDIFPNASHAGFFEWFYNKEKDVKYFPKIANSVRISLAVNRQRNMCILDALASCDTCIAPTEWQKIQHPQEFWNKIHVLHDGIQTDYFAPQYRKKLELKNCDFTGCDEIVTFATRGLEPFRGFPFFYRSLETVLRRRPNCHVVIMASDTTCYGDKRMDGKTWKQHMLETVELDMTRVHFLPYSPYNIYRNLLLNSSVHVYLTVPFVLSWSLIESMSCGCQIVSSDVAPVREVITNGKEATLVNMENISCLASAIIDGLERTKKGDMSMRNAARAKAVAKYSLKDLLPQQLNLLHSGVQAMQNRHLVKR